MRERLVVAFLAATLVTVLVFGAMVLLVRDPAEVVLTGALLVGLSAGAGLVVARWLAVPFHDLATEARALGRGRMDLALPSYSVPEAEDIARSLERAGRQVQDIMTRHRAFLLDASHELRTPITALRLELEDLSFAGELSAGATEQLQRSMGELERLNSSVDAMLAATRERRVGDVDLAALARDAVTRWLPHLARVGRRVELVGTGPAPVRLAAGAVEQVLDGLLGNALTNGGGTVTLTVLDAGDHVCVQVGDEGPAPEDLPATLEPTRAAAAAFGGHLALDRAATTTYVLRLPSAR